MANPEHVEIVKAGAVAIAEWRQTSPEENLDLCKADLADVDLTSVDLRDANLQLANLARVNLDDANLEGAAMPGAKLMSASLISTRFDGANLESADLSGATMLDANLVYTVLNSAVLNGSSLKYANLTGAAVPSADFAEAIFGETTLVDMNLGSAKNLEKVKHADPSAIDERTLRKSWPLPDVFLRGIGLSDELIDFARATYGKAIEFYSCFISYSSKDQKFAERLHADLQQKGVRCWFAPEDLRIGDKTRLRIDESIRLHDKLLLILSKDSMQSEWVESEVEAAFERERKQKRTVLFPIRIDNAVMRTRRPWAAEIRRTSHIGDFRAWKDHDAYQKAFERLLRDLKS